MPVASTLRVIVRVLLDAPVTSTISSRAVSGSSTIVNVALALIDAADTVANKIDALATLIVVPPDVTAEVSVVCWERDVYKRVVIYLPIGCSGRELGTGVFALTILLQDVAKIVVAVDV